MLGPEDLAKFEDLLKNLDSLQQNKIQFEHDLGEIPDEFLDPLMSDIMKDPVMLPSSGIGN